MRTFNHVGIVTTEQVEGAMFNEGLKVWLTDYSKSPNRIEFLKFEEGSCLPYWYRNRDTLPTPFLLWRKS